MGKRKDTHFRFLIHEDIEKGPNRTATETHRAMKYFKSVIRRRPQSSPVVVALHVSSGLQFIATNEEEFLDFITRVVEKHDENY